MKKYLAPALAIALVGASIASLAQSTPIDHPSHDMQGMMVMDSSTMQAMQKKMSVAKTDEERQVRKAECQTQMSCKEGSMMGMNHDGKFGPTGDAPGGMMGMRSGEMQAMRETMQEKMTAAKTDAERKALMSEQQRWMMERRAHMMPTNANCHDMNGISGNMAERRQMMQRRMGMIPM